MAPPDRREEILARYYPDLNASKTFYGTLLSVRFVPVQYGVTVSPNTGNTKVHRMGADRWVALVATEHGTQQMDATTLRVMWPMSAGDPIWGEVTEDEIARHEKEIP